jgi:hypothetical protein
MVTTAMNEPSGDHRALSTPVEVKTTLTCGIVPPNFLVAVADTGGTEALGDRAAAVGEGEPAGALVTSRYEAPTMSATPIAIAPSPANRPEGRLTRRPVVSNALIVGSPDVVCVNLRR